MSVCDFECKPYSRTDFLLLLLLLQQQQHNPQNIRCETGRTFKNKEREYLKDKISELGTNNKNENITDLYRGIH
jgi:hypothetical protein